MINPVRFRDRLEAVTVELCETRNISHFIPSVGRPCGTTTRVCHSPFLVSLAQLYPLDREGLTSVALRDSERARSG